MISITNENGVYCFGTGAYGGVDKSKVKIAAHNHGKVRFCVEKNLFLKGKYYIDLGIQHGDDIIYDYIYNALEFRVNDNDKAHVGIVQLEGYWDIDGQIVAPQNL